MNSFQIRKNRNIHIFNVYRFLKKDLQITSPYTINLRIFHFPLPSRLKHDLELERSWLRIKNIEHSYIQNSWTKGSQVVCSNSNALITMNVCVIYVICT